MSIFGSIWEKITGRAKAETGSTQGGPATGGGAAAPQGDRPAPSPDAAPARMQAVDVAAIMDGLARENPQRLDWRHSIVDLMKLLGLDSSQTARRELAQELHYSGDPSDSAAMNMWLHRQVMQKLAENGGKVPEDLRR
ncbi:hypothetical protein GCM10011504_34680 [Siccirubricoccus deserti]|uniref:DUF3597 domain-containing protein n=1 Tax=Siccirubricoccus deserti TaxID=2013562 RepID=A0A9X0UFH0_9PROT|nr:DUF3597 domain-containing protein [Siccirubricoccus deserti]MBC4017863.1 DUF3597 domain-containing protein [Siccirubricoccus deserti]GGC53386.1 hypothetical protein GCM10011504_34680 [Siccirubricoccus deserti]